MQATRNTVNSFQSTVHSIKNSNHEEHEEKLKIKKSEDRSQNSAYNYNKLK